MLLLLLLRALRGKEAHYGKDHFQVANMSLILLRALRGKEAQNRRGHLQVASRTWIRWCIGSVSDAWWRGTIGHAP